MKKAVVLGGAGFVGSHLCESLVKKDLQVVCVDNLVTGSSSNIKDLSSYTNFKFYKQDITECPLTEQHVDYVFDLASPASPVDYSELPEETLLANSVGTIHALKLAADTNARFLFASTSEVYGDPLEHPQKETYWGNVNPFGPRSCYDESKRFSEAASYVYWKKYGLDVRLLRIFNTYGPRMRVNDGRVISNFINQALRGEDITIYGSGKQTRSFCYVSDLVKGIESFMFTDSLAGEIVNLGNPEEHTIKDIAETIKEMTSSESTILYKDLPQDDPARRKPDITKAKSLLNWQPEVPLSDGLRNTIEYYVSLQHLHTPAPLG